MVLFSVYCNPSATAKLSISQEHSFVSNILYFLPEIAQDWKCKLEKKKQNKTRQNKKRAIPTTCCCSGLNCYTSASFLLPHLASSYLSGLEISLLRFLCYFKSRLPHNAIQINRKRWSTEGWMVRSIYYGKSLYILKG